MFGLHKMVLDEFSGAISFVRPGSTMVGSSSPMDLDTREVLAVVVERIDTIESSLGMLRVELRDGLAHLEGRVEETRRRAEILNESVRDDVRLVAEHVIALL
jgi:hypothetical protein